jgi:Transposase zinc-binding domain/Putative transposase
VPCGERAAVSVADVLRDHVPALCLDQDQAKAAAHILACRTGRLGGHLAVCDRCGHTHFAYHSCRDRHCPRCGSLDQALWAEAQLPQLLPLGYFHLVFTVPASLRPFFARQGRAWALDALFAAVSETILQTAARRGLRPGVLAVLHTWTQKLTSHPHLHCLVTGGGLGQNGFVHRRRYLLPLKVLRPVFKAKLLGRLQALSSQRRLGEALRPPVAPGCLTPPVEHRYPATPGRCRAGRPLLRPLHPQDRHLRPASAEL